VTRYLPSRIPFVVSCSYLGLLTLLFAFAFIPEGDGTLPLLYATIPLSVILKDTSSDVRLAIIEAGLINASIIYLILKIVFRTRLKRKYSRTTK
jgi:hypothetical protein